VYRRNVAFARRVRLHQGDVTALQVDAVTNAANTALLAGGGICGAIFDAAGPRQLQRACDAVRARSSTRGYGGRGVIPPGQTRLTRGFRLPAPFILHTVGPDQGSQTELEDAYKATLDECLHPQLLDAQPDEQISIRSVALCCIR
jgi:O-acetyl-ADP-ribose deacetylase (regulator of RNase III)